MNQDLIVTSDCGLDPMTRDWLIKLESIFYGYARLTLSMKAISNSRHN